MLTPELQRIIEKITSYATTPIYSPGQNAPTASQGRALLGVGDMLKDIQTSSQAQAGAGARTSMVEQGAMERAKLADVGATNRATESITATEKARAATEAGLNTRASVVAGLEGRKLGILEKSAEDARKLYPTTGGVGTPATSTATPIPYYQNPIWQGLYNPRYTGDWGGGGGEGVSSGSAE